MVVEEVLTDELATRRLIPEFRWKDDGRNAPSCTKDPLLLGLRGKEVVQLFCNIYR